ncbi:MAG: glycosyltransferase family 2 protein [Methylococcales bacterium]|nr:glycosyltransferase family 2 protein [Methylococcales bacterium]
MAHSTSNKADIIVSLIMATYHRKEEVACFIKSLVVQDFDIKKIELIIVDQNSDGLLDIIVAEYQSQLKIIHIKSTTLGLSLNRNIGIKSAKGSILCFPDDDCTYYPNTLAEVHRLFLENDRVTTLLGQIIDVNGHKIIRKWPDNTVKLSSMNFFTLYSSITVFTKCKNTYFDVRLGIGNKFGSYEDADYILSLLRENPGAMYYYPNIKVSHPPLNIKTMSPEKVVNYGLGFGAFCKKNISFYIFTLYLKVIIYHVLMMLLAVLKMDSVELKKRYLSTTSRIKGFLVFQDD